MIQLVKRISRSPRTIPVFVLILLGLPVLLHTAVFVLAEQHPSLVVDGEYFLTPEQQAESRRAIAEFEERGWSVELGEISRSAVDGGFGFDLKIVDANGTVVPDFEYTVDVFHHARARHVIRAEVVPVDGGVKHVRVPSYRRGRWDVRIDASRNGTNFPLVRAVWTP